MRFLVEMAYSGAPTPEMLALIPAEMARGKELDAQGVREALYVAADNSRAWQVFRAGSLEEATTLAHSFPLASHCTIAITPLMGEQGAAS